MFGPLIVAMTSGRSGSSMICGIIEKHGAWTGPTKGGDWRNPDGFYENMEVYKACDHYGQFKKEIGFAKHDGRWPEKFKKIIKKQGYKSGPLIIKHIPNCWPIWDEMSPVYITIRRDIHAQIASREKIRKNISIEALLGREKAMDFLEKEKGAIRIDSPSVIGGDYKQIARAVTQAGLVFNKNICKNFINPEYWHF